MKLMMAAPPAAASIQQLLQLVLLGCSFVSYSEACSRRTTPKPRPPPPTLRPNNTQAQTQDCPPPYHSNFCLNGGSCFSIQIGESPPSINCECTAGWTGRRCELKDLPDDYYVKKGSTDVKQARLAGGVAAIVVIVVLIVAVAVYIVRKRRRKSSRTKSISISTKEHPFSCRIDYKHHILQDPTRTEPTLPARTKPPDETNATAASV